MGYAFLDTNVILRYLLRDDELNAQRCLELLEKGGEKGDQTSHHLYVNQSIDFIDVYNAIRMEKQGLTQI